MILPIVVGLSAWAWGGIVTGSAAAAAVAGNAIANRRQAYRLQAAYEEGGKRALKRAIYDEGLAVNPEHCEMLALELIAAMTAAEEEEAEDAPAPRRARRASAS
jgi:hypothetical protein